MVRTGPSVWVRTHAIPEFFHSLDGRWTGQSLPIHARLKYGRQRVLDGWTGIKDPESAKT